MTVQKLQTKGAQGYTEINTIETSAGAADKDKVPSTNANGVLDPTIINAKNASAGAADAGKVPLTNASGVLDKSFINSTASSAGAADAGKHVALGTDGKLDLTVLPVGVGTDSIAKLASESISAGDLINIASDGSVRKADASNNRPAMGFAPSAIANGASGVVLLEGTNSGVTGRTPGKMQFLGLAGAMVETPPSGAGVLWQPVGLATTATSMTFSWTIPTTQAA